METFNTKNIRLVSLKETIDTTTPTGKLLYTILSSLAQFERDILVERTNEGLKAARARGRTGGRPKTDTKAMQKAVALYQTKEYSITDITDLTGVSKSALYRVLKARQSGAWFRESNREQMPLQKPETQLVSGIWSGVPKTKIFGSFFVEKMCLRQVI